MASTNNNPSPTAANAMAADKALYDRQYALEVEQSDIGAALFRHHLERRRAHGQSRGQLATTRPGRELVSHAAPPFAAAIESELESALAGKPGRGRPSTFVKRLTRKRRDGGRELSCPALTLAGIAASEILNAVLEGSGSSEARLSQRIGKAVEAQLMLRQFEKEKPRLFRRIQDGLSEQGATPAHRLRRLIHAVRTYEINWKAWGGNDAEQVGAWLLMLFIDPATGIGMVERQRTYLGKGKRPYLIKARPETIERFEGRATVHGRLNPHLMPMLVPPRPWQRDPKEGGGYLAEIPGARFDFVLRGKPLRKAQRDASRLAVNEARRSGQLDAHVLRAVNAIQATPWRINQNVLDVVRDAWREGSHLPDIPDPRNEAIPEKPEDIGSNDVARKRWRKEAREIHNRNHRLVAERLGFLALLNVAERFAEEAAIYLPHQLDFRGRVYSASVRPAPTPDLTDELEQQGRLRYLSPQGADMEKALLEFAEGKPIVTDQAEEWLLRHGQGLWDDEWDWCDDEIRAVALDPFDHRRWTGADKPWQFLAWCYEWAAYREHGRGFLSRLPVAMDGKCNGIQHLTLLARDEETAPRVNLNRLAGTSNVLAASASQCPAPAARDIYETVADEVNLRLTEEGGDRVAMAWKHLGIDRAIVKQPVMTLGYGSTRRGIGKQITKALWKKMEKDAQGLPLDWDWEKAGKPNQALFDALCYLALIVDDSRAKCLKRPLAIMEWLKKHAAIMSKANLPLTWTSPAGFPVHQESRKTREGVVKVRFRGRDHQLAKHAETEKVDGRDQGQSIAPNFVHSMDAAHLHRAVARCVDEGITSFATAHDCFSTHAADAEHMNAVLVQELAAMYVVHGGPLLHPLAKFQEELKRLHPSSDAVDWPPLPELGTYDPRSAMLSIAFAP